MAGYNQTPFFTLIFIVILAYLYKNFPIMRSIIEQNLFVHISLGGDRDSGDYHEIVGATEVMSDQSVGDWLRQEKGLFVAESNIVMLNFWCRK